jgi:esterase/lipase
MPTPDSPSKYTYQEAARIIKAMQDHSGDCVLPISQTRLFTKGKPTNIAVLFFHGYTSSPQQFAPLGEFCHKKGWNVFIPRVPHHGHKTRIDESTRKLTLGELIEFANSSLDLALALGEKVIVSGLSMGGILTAYLAQTRPEIGKAVAIAPAMGFHAVPNLLLPLVMKYTLMRPDYMRWWDPEKKEDEPGPGYAYAWFSAHGLAYITNLGFQAMKLARSSAPLTKDIWMVVNDNDESVDNTNAKKLLASWQKIKPDAIHFYEFPKEMGLVHDLISVEQPKQQVDKVYPKLMEIFEN